MRKRCQGGAPGQGRMVGGEREEVGSPWAPNRCGDARRRAELRRQISSSSVCLERRNEREGERRSWAIYSRDFLLRGLGFWADLIGRLAGHRAGAGLPAGG
jgi:hypothetical protein